MEERKKREYRDGSRKQIEKLEEEKEEVEKGMRKLGCRRGEEYHNVIIHVPIFLF